MSTESIKSVGNSHYPTPIYNPVYNPIKGTTGDIARLAESHLLNIRLSELTQSTNTLAPITFKENRLIQFLSRTIHQGDPNGNVFCYNATTKAKGLETIQQNLEDRNRDLRKAPSLMLVFTPQQGNCWSLGEPNQVPKILKKLLHTIYNTAFIGHFASGVHPLEVELWHPQGIEDAKNVLCQLKSYKNGALVVIVRYHNGYVETASDQELTACLPSLAQPIVKTNDDLSKTDNRRNNYYPIINLLYYFEPEVSQHPEDLSSPLSSPSPLALLRSDLPNNFHLKHNRLYGLDWDAIRQKFGESVQRPCATGNMAFFLDNCFPINPENIKLKLKNHLSSEYYVFGLNDRDVLEQIYRIPPEKDTSLIPPFDNLQEIVKHRTKELIQQQNITLDNEQLQADTTSMYASRVTHRVHNLKTFFEDRSREEFAIHMLESTGGACVDPTSSACTRIYLDSAKEKYTYTNLKPFCIAYESRQVMMGKAKETLNFKNTLGLTDEEKSDYRTLSKDPIQFFNEKARSGELDLVLADYLEKQILLIKKHIEENKKILESHPQFLQQKCLEILTQYSHHIKSDTLKEFLQEHLVFTIDQNIEKTFAYPHDFAHHNIIEQFYTDPKKFAAQLRRYPLAYKLKLYTYQSKYQSKQAISELNQKTKIFISAKCQESATSDLVKREVRQLLNLLPLGSEFYQDRPWLKSPNAAIKYLDRHKIIKKELKEKEIDLTGQDLQLAKQSRQFLFEQALYLHKLNRTAVFTIFNPESILFAYLGLNPNV